MSDFLDIDNIYQFATNKQIGQTSWPNTWINAIKNKLRIRIREAKRCIYLKNELMDLKTELIEVSFTTKWLLVSNKM